MQEPLEIFAKMFPDSELVYPTGHGGDVIGIDLYNKRLILSLDKVIETLMEEMTEEEAWDWFGFNMENPEVIYLFYISLEDAEIKLPKNLLKRYLGIDYYTGKPIIKGSIVDAEKYKDEIIVMLPNLKFEYIWEVAEWR